MNCNRPFVPISVIVALLIPVSVAAHSTQYYVSTPFSVPRGWESVPVLFLLLCGLWYCWAFRGERKRWSNTIQFLGCTCLGIVLALLFGMFFAGMNTAPPPGFGFGYPPFKGYGWKDVGALFVIGNLIGLGIILGVLAVYMRKRVNIEYRIGRKAILAGITVIYLVSLIPFVAGRAMTFGWHGGYVSMDCRMRLSRLMLALAEYAVDHGERLPKAKNSEEFVAALFPYVEEKAYEFYEPQEIFVCPIEDSWEPKPRPYRYSSGLSGTSLDELYSYDPNVRVVVCHAEHGYGVVHEITVGQLIGRIREVIQDQRNMADRSQKEEAQQSHSADQGR